MKNYSAYLFDLDGTLVDSEKLKGKALAETCSLFGGVVGADIYKVVMGESWFHVTSHFFRMAKIEPDFEKFNAEFRAIYQKILRKELAPNPNVVELLIKLKEAGKKLGVVSSASTWMVDQVLSQLNLLDYFEVVITNEQVTKHKPHPEAYLLALEKLAIPSSEVLVFEDSNAGIIAANEANCDSVAFRHKFNVNHDFSFAIQVIADFNEFHLVE